MACHRSLYPPVANIPYRAHGYGEVAFYVDPQAGAYRLQGGSLKGALVRDVPECYHVWNTLDYHDPGRMQASRRYLFGLRRLEDILGIALPGPDLRGAAALEPWYTDQMAGGHVLRFGKYEGLMIHQVPLAYLLWTRGDLSDRCRFSPLGRLYFVALQNYMRGIEAYYGKERAIEVYETMPRENGITRVLFVSPGFKGVVADGQITFTYADLEHANTIDGDIRVTAITKALFEQINAVKNFDWANY